MKIKPELLGYLTVDGSNGPNYYLSKNLHPVWVYFSSKLPENYRQFFDGRNEQRIFKDLESLRIVGMEIQSEMMQYDEAAWELHEQNERELKNLTED